MNNKISKHPTSRKRGITLLIAVLTSSLLLSISLSIFNIAIKELVISSFGRDSHIAFYAADSGIECALYWDYRGAFEPDEETEISCHAQYFYVGGAPASSFTITDSATGSCVITSIDKSGPDTVIEARGYNTCVAGSARRTERGIRVRY